jgi:imidazole glycerol phosphate synthase glutamine amidotransferase subunit
LQITLIDYGAGNLPSVERAFQHLGASTVRATTPETIAAASVLVLPGVGHFRMLMHALEAQLLAEPIREALDRSVPFLGICLGMHALFEGSAGEDQEGFGVFSGYAQPLPQGRRSRHLGWDQLERIADGRLLRGISTKAWFYFAHSEAVVAGMPSGSSRVIEMRPATRAVEPPLGTVALCHHGRPFVAVAERGCWFAVQFLPEKSGEAGMDVLRNFLGTIR